MSKEKKDNRKEETPIPFNEALKRVWAAPPQHKKAKKKKAKKTAK